ncbi:hypothetical protein [Erwinia persicina]|uniref:hypothetical protein n=1 Tax=Erwinia persicina TaxID=55211 RepID=UPI0017837F9F|nr:hypothetical protein [Erwinia persicina]MBD8213072.1 hypothetical protein [Erwinia persicina]
MVTNKKSCTNSVQSPPGLPYGSALQAGRMRGPGVFYFRAIGCLFSNRLRNRFTLLKCAFTPLFLCNHLNKREKLKTGRMA